MEGISTFLSVILTVTSVGPMLLESIKIEKRPRDDSIDIVNKDNCKIPHLETKNAESWHRIWDELSNIVRTLLSVNSNQINDREINDLLMVISIDPAKLIFFDIEYGSQNVDMAIKKSLKVLYPNGIMDENLSDYLCCRRKKLIRQSNISNLSKKSMATLRGIKTVSTALHNLNIFNVPQYQRQEFVTQESQLFILMSVDPDILHYDEASIDISQSKCEIGIAQCKHLLERIMKSCRQETEFQTFQAKRNKNILIHGRLNVKNQFTNYDDIFKNVRVVVEKYWHDKSELQLNALTVLFIMEPKLIHSKYLFTTINNDECLDSIEDEVRDCLNKSIDKKAATSKNIKCTVYAGVVNPIITYFDPPLTTKKLKDLRKQLRQEDNHEMPPKVLDLNEKCIVCSNTEAFEWLKTRLNKKHAIQNKEEKKIRVAMLSQLRLRLPFSTYMEIIKEQHPYLPTELWVYLESESDSMIYVQMDMNSIAALEQRKRCIQVNENILKFKMFYAP